MCLPAARSPVKNSAVRLGLGLELLAGVAPAGDGIRLCAQRTKGKHALVKVVPLRSVSFAALPTPWPAHSPNIHRMTSPAPLPAHRLSPPAPPSLAHTALCTLHPLLPVPPPPPVHHPHL